MSLFEMPRYLGEDEEPSLKTKSESFEKLKKVLDSAKKRKQKLALETGIDDASLDTSVTEKKQNKKRKLSEGIDSDVDDSKTQDSDSCPKIGEKKKRKVTLSTEGDEEDHITVESDTEKGSSHKKKKKKKKSLSAGSESDTQKIDSKTAESSDLEKTPKKHKKKKDKSDSADTLEKDLTQADTNISLDETPAKDELNAGDAGEAQPMETEETNEEGTTERRKDGHREVGGFTVIGSIRKAKIAKVKRVLPDWLANPSIISGDLTTDKLPVSEMPGLGQDIVQLLQDNAITHFFPVQRLVIPTLLESSLTGFQTGRAGYRPSDICVSAPTGSGKTLAFVLPIIQALRSRLTCEVRALAVLPVKDLAAQVFKVFQAYSKNTGLKVGLLIGQKPMAIEQQMLVKKTLSGYRSQYDIIVATPGRLVEHINKTHGFNLAQLRYLVIDEADRMMEEIKQDWLLQVENTVYKSRPRPGPLTAANCLRMQMPLQKLLYSATLSQNPEKLQQLNLFEPRLYTSVVTRATPAYVVPSQKSAASNDTPADTSHDPEQQQQEVDEAMEEEEPGELKKKLINLAMGIDGEEEATTFVGKYATPASLTEFYIEASMQTKPLVVLHLLHHLNYRNILCFTNSVEATHRLYLLIKLVGGVTVKEFSSNLHVARRNAIIQKFTAGKIDILVCSDAMARGMDISTVKYVVSYDPPKHIQTYIHRIGRTARAGHEGTAFTLLQVKEFFHFKKMIKEAGKKSLKSMKVSNADMKPIVPKYKEALEKLAEVLQEEKLRKMPNKRQPRKNVKKDGVKAREEEAQPAADKPHDAEVIPDDAEVIPDDAEVIPDDAADEASGSDT